MIGVFYFSLQLKPAGVSMDVCGYGHSYGYGSSIVWARSNVIPSPLLHNLTTLVILANVGSQLYKFIGM